MRGIKELSYGIEKKEKEELDNMALILQKLQQLETALNISAEETDPVVEDLEDNKEE